jgi:hypothetical protein
MAAKKLKNDPEILAAVIAGYEGKENPSMFSSAMWMAHEAGKEMRFLNGPHKVITSARLSTGYSVKFQTAGLFTWRAKFEGALLDNVTIERI